MDDDPASLMLMEDLEWDAFCQLLAKIGIVSPSALPFSHHILVGHDIRNDVRASSQFLLLRPDLKREGSSDGQLQLQLPSAFVTEQSSVAGVRPEN